MSDGEKELGSRMTRVSSAENLRGAVPTEETLSSPVAPTKGECVGLYSDVPLPHSPTRAPSGWSLSLSLSRAKRALVDEEREESKKKPRTEPEQQVEPKPARRVTLVDLQQLPSTKKVPQHVKPARTRPSSTTSTHSSLNSSGSDLEEGEVPPSPPRGSLPSKVALSFINDDEVEELKLKNEALEQQVAFLRKTNQSLAAHVSDSKDVLYKEEVKKLNKKVTNSKKRITASENECTELKAALKSEKKKAANLEQNVKSLETKLERANGKISDLESQRKTLRDEIAAFKVKIANQRANLTGLENQLIKFKSNESKVPSFFKVPTKPENISPNKCHCVNHCRCRDLMLGLECEVSNLRTRIKNQTFHLANLTAAFDKTKLEASRVKTLELELKRTLARVDSVEQKTSSKSISCHGLKTEVSDNQREIKNEIWKPPVIVLQSPETSSQNDSLGTLLFEKKVFKVISDNFIMAKSIMQNFDETAYTLPVLRPAYRATIAAMPPATRTLCIGEVMALLPSPSDLLTKTSSKWFDDPDLQGNDPARMALFWGFHSARHLAGGGAGGAAAPGPAPPSLSMWNSPLPSSGVVKNEEHIAKDENGNVVRGRRRRGSAEASPVKMQQVPVKEQAGLSVSSQTSPAEVQQVPAKVDAGAPASPAISPVKALQQGPAEAEAGALASAEAPLVEEQQQVPAHSALTMESDSPVSNWQAIPAAELESCTARAGGPSAGADGATEDTVLSSVDGAPTGQPGCTDESAGTDAAVTAFLHSMYESTRTSRSPEFVPPQWGSAHQSHQHASPAEATPGAASTAPSLTVSYPLYLYGGTKYQCPVPSGSEPTGFSTQFLTPDQSQYGCQLPQYGCELPPHLLQKKTAQQSSLDVEALAASRPNRISFNIKELKKRITTHLKPCGPDPNT